MNDPTSPRWPGLARRQLGKYTIWCTKDGLSISYAGEGTSVDVQFTPAQTLEIMRLIQFKRDVLERETEE